MAPGSSPPGGSFSAKRKELKERNMALPTAQKTARRLGKILGDRNIRRIPYAKVYKAARRAHLRGAFLDEVQSAAQEDGIIVGYGNRFVLLGKD